MGCSTSKLDDEEVVQLCKDRRRFIQQAVEQRIRFASGHVAYVQSLRRVAAALRNYVEGDEPRDFFVGSYSTPPFTPIKNSSSPSISSVSSKSFSAPPKIQSEPKSSSFRIHYSKSGGTAAVSVEERPPSPETVRVESYASPMHDFGMSGFFPMQSSPMNPSSYYSSSSNTRPNFPPQSPPNSQWDFFWNPFNSLDAYGYPSRYSIDHTNVDDDITGLRQVREAEGIPDLEEEGVDEERSKVDSRAPDKTVDIEDNTDCNCDSDSDDDDDDTTESEGGHEVKGLQKQGRESVEISEPQNAVELEVHKNDTVGHQEGKEETPGFTVYVNKRPTTMAEVVKDIETQFVRVCDSATEVSTMLEARKAQYASTSHEHTGAKMLNPVALFRSASSRSSSSRFFNNSSSSRDDGYDSTSDLAEDACMFSGSHQSTLDRLYAWEKKLYIEVRSGERIRIAYEKKCAQLRNQDVKGEDPSVIDKTRVAIRDLHTQIKVSIHSVESISKRIETLKDEELLPQLLELIQGLSRMWGMMAECHQYQKRAVDEAKLLLASATNPKANLRRQSDILLSNDPSRLAQTGVKLESELRNWGACFETWITAQRSYIHAITGWLLRCVQCDSDTSKLPFSPRRSNGTPAIFGICIQWSRFLDTIQENSVIDGIDFFAGGMGSLYAQQLRDEMSASGRGGSKRFPVVSSKRFSPDTDRRSMVAMEAPKIEEDTTAEKSAEVAAKVLCAGLYVSISSLTDFAMNSAEGYSELVKQWVNATTTTTRKIEV
ncbi:hypothetical protein ACHQM5_030374 [Ranunculus cassubicifolius]